MLKQNVHLQDHDSKVEEEHQRGVGSGWYATKALVTLSIAAPLFGIMDKLGYPAGVPSSSQGSRGDDVKAFGAAAACHKMHESMIGLGLAHPSKGWVEKKHALSSWMRVTSSFPEGLGPQALGCRVPSIPRSRLAQSHEYPSYLTDCGFFLGSSSGGRG